jgi:hypothetical protein
MYNDTELLFALVFLGFMVMIFVIMEVVRRFLWMIIFKRLGEKPWKAWVPVVDLWTVFRLGGFPGYLSIPVWVILVIYVYFAITNFDQNSPIAIILLLLLLPIIVVSLMACYRITKKMGLHGAYFLIYLAGEIAWLAVLVLVTMDTQGNSKKHKLAP